LQYSGGPELSSAGLPGCKVSCPPEIDEVPPAVVGEPDKGVVAVRAANNDAQIPHLVDQRSSEPFGLATAKEMVSEGRRGDAVEYFMSEVVGLPPEFVAFARTQPFWQAQEALAHTLGYDAAVIGDYSLPVERAAAVTVPTLVIAGGASFPFLLEAARALADVILDGQHRILEGQEHNVDPEVLAPVLVEFFKVQSGTL
jgi:hypothetical protein